MLDAWVDDVGLKPGGALLEIGCGPGVFSRQLAQRSLQVMGIDYSNAMMVAARKLESANVNLAFMQGDASRLPCPDNHFDYVIASSLINIVDNPARALQEMRRVTAPFGTLSVLVPSVAMTIDAADRYVRENKLRGFAKSALRTWAAMAPKMSTERLEILFERARLTMPVIRSQLDGMVLTATLRKVF